MREATLPALLESADLLPAMDGGGEDDADLLRSMDGWRGACWTLQICSPLWMGGGGEPLSRLLIVCRTCSVVVLWFIAGIPQAGRARNSGPLTVLLPTLTIHPRKG